MKAAFSGPAYNGRTGFEASAGRERDWHRSPVALTPTVSRPDDRPIPLEPPAPITEDRPLTAPDVAAFGTRLRDGIRHGMQIAEPVLDVVLSALLAGGHLLLEDRPGVGKTQLARSIAGAVVLLPTDILDASIGHAGSDTFECHPGPIFANVVLVDVLHRATPKTQSGLREAMQELRVTLDGVPARVVTGFATGTSAHDRTYDVRDTDAHAWIEVYVDGFGWVPFNPTPATSAAAGGGGAHGAARSPRPERRCDPGHHPGRAASPDRPVDRHARRLRRTGALRSGIEGRHETVSERLARPDRLPACLSPP